MAILPNTLINQWVIISGMLPAYQCKIVNVQFVSHLHIMEITDTRLIWVTRA
jgi:hypothetical protein